MTGRDEDIPLPDDDAPPTLGLDGRDAPPLHAYADEQTAEDAKWLAEADGDDIPFPADGPEDSHLAEPELEVPGLDKQDTRTISQRAAANRPAGSASAQGNPNADYLQGLNPEQKDAVLSVDGPLLVLAGAGTGKTRVLTSRIAHIIATRRAWPSQMLVVTFTNKAAREMRDRAIRLIGPDAEGLRWLGTFHSVSAQILRRHAEAAKLKPTFTVIDTDDQLRLIRQVLEAENIDQKRWTPRYLLSLIDGWKNRAIRPEQLDHEDARKFADGKGAKIYQIYQDRLSVLNAVDFGDLLMHTITVFQREPEILAQYHQRFRYLLVDEYQDTNVAQYMWLRLLAQNTGAASNEKPAHNICCVGDDDQSIYGWRGAEVDNILRFEKDFPGAKIVRLEQNYRSTAHILAAASRVIATNTSRLGKTLRTDAGEGDLVKVRGVWDGEQEARLISEDIDSWLASRGREKRRHDDCAVLVRASWQMRAFEERFILAGIPYRVIGGPRFFERAEIRDALAYLRLIRSEADDLAFERVVNVPKRGVGDTTIQKVHVVARQMNTPLSNAADMMLRSDELKGPAKTGLRRFIVDLERWRAESLRLEAPRLLEMILEESGYTDMLQADKSPQSQSRLDNLKELVRSVGAFDSLQAFLEHVELVMDNAEGSGADDQVQVLTLHSAKGLEWPMVFLPGWEEEVFPSRRTLDESGAKGLEEERRLAYVGITRARERCYISFAANRQIYGRWTSVLPSRFIDELPPEHVDAVSETGYVSPGGMFYGSETQGNVSPMKGGTGPQGRGGSYFSERPVSSQFDAPGQSFGSTYDSPGWKRAQAAARRENEGVRNRPRPPDIEASPRLQASSSSEGGLKLGQRVFHQKFGNGKIVGIEGAKLTVAFDAAGIKKVVESFVEKVG